MHAGRGRVWAAVATLAVVVAAAAIGAKHGKVRRPRASSRPDVLLVVLDTCRADRVEVGGYGRPTTPRLSKLASIGTTFRRCLTPSPWTPPSHGSLFTGLLPRHHGVREGAGDRVAPGIPLLAETLRAGGYETVAFTANPHISPATGLDAGFDTVFRCYAPVVGKWTADRVEGQVRTWLDLRRARGVARKPLFAFVNLMDAHLPYTFDAAAVKAVRGHGELEAARAASTIPEKTALAHLYGVSLLDDRTLRALDVAYDGAVRTDDAAMGGIFDAFRDDGYLENAFVAVTADHGENLGEHGEMSHIMSVHEPVLRVPLVVSWPGRFEGGRVEEAQVRLQDLYPTILEVAGLPVPAPCGRDAVPLTERPLLPRVAVAEYAAPYAYVGEAHAGFPGVPESRWERFYHSLLAVREEAPGRGALKYIATRLVDPIQGKETLLKEELFDMAADPGELENLLGAAPEPVHRARADRLRAIGEAETPPR